MGNAAAMLAATAPDVTAKVSVGCAAAASCTMDVAVNNPRTAFLVIQALFSAAQLSVWLDTLRELAIERANPDMMVGR